MLVCHLPTWCVSFITNCSSAKGYCLAALIWITGLSGSGKTTVAEGVVDILRGKLTNLVHLDGDLFREILGNDVDHSLNGRRENAWRIARMCNFLVKQDIFVVCSTMSLYSEIHAHNRRNIENYIEVFIDCDFKELIRRDQKGLYTGALAGKKSNVVGFDLSFDKPLNPELHLDNTDDKNKTENINTIVSFALRYIK